MREITQRMQDINSYTSAVAISVESGEEAATGEDIHNVASAATGAKGIVAALGEVAGGVTSAIFGADDAGGVQEEVESATEKLRREVEETGDGGGSGFSRSAGRAGSGISITAPPHSPACPAHWRRRGSGARYAMPP